MIFDDRFDGYTANGYLFTEEISSNSSATDWAIVNYLIKADAANNFRLYLRGQSDSANFKASILLDDRIANTIDNTGIGTSWTWVNSEIVLPDTKIHTLGIRIEENTAKLDRVYLDKDSASPSGNGPSLSVSPFVTIHLQIYETKSSEPTTPLFIYDWKTTLDEITADDWYNFDITFLGGVRSIAFNSSYAIVLSASGGTETNFVIWELLDNDEYAALPSVIKV